MLQALEYAHTFIRILWGTLACVSADLLLYVYRCRLLCLQFQEQEETRSVWPCRISNDVACCCMYICLRGGWEFFLKIFWPLSFSSSSLNSCAVCSIQEWHRMHELYLLLLNSKWCWTLWPLFDVVFACWKKEQFQWSHLGQCGCSQLRSWSAFWNWSLRA